MPVEEKRAVIAELERSALADLMDQHPESRAVLDRSVGYAILAKAVTKVPVFGAGDGLGVAVDTRSGERTYLRVGRFDVGGGLGARRYRLVMIFTEPEPLAKLRSGKLELNVGAEASAGRGDTSTGSGEKDASGTKGYVVYRLADEGLSATWTVSITRYSVLDLEE